MAMMSKRVQAILWWMGALGLLIWAAFDPSVFKFALAALAAIYGGLVMAQDLIIRRGTNLSQGELKTWGQHLSNATPDILELSELGNPPGDIAERIHDAHGLPPEVTLKYIIALGRYGGN